MTRTAHPLLSEIPFAQTIPKKHLLPAQTPAPERQYIHHRFERSLPT